MIIKEHELLQIDEKFICRLREQDPDALTGLTIKLVSDLKEALERLNQNPSNSSRPSGSLAPWDKGIVDDEDESNADEKQTLPPKTGVNKEETTASADVSVHPLSQTDANSSILLTKFLTQPSYETERP